MIKSKEQKRNMSQREFIAFSACTMMLTALGIDIMLPVFSDVRQHFRLPAESAATALIITFFFMGQIAQIIFGTLSDRYGRKVILRIGFPLYIIGGLMATLSPSMEIMYLSRFIAGVGASAVFMTTIASVRDRFVGDEMARIMSLIFTIFLFTPVFAPFLGLAIVSISSWQFVFLTPPIFAVIIFIWSSRLTESWKPLPNAQWNLADIMSAFRLVLANKVFVRYVSITTLLFAGLSTYVANSERIVTEIYHRPELFPWIFAAIGLLMCFSALSNSRAAERYGARKVLRIMLVVYTAVAAALVAITVWMGDPPPMTVFFVCVGFLMAINLAIEPNSSALAMEPMGDKAGTASAVYGTCFFFVGSSIGWAISYFLSSGLLVLVIGYLLIGLAGVLLAFGDKRVLSKSNR